MIDVKIDITGKEEPVETDEEFFAGIKERMLDSIELNFIHGGRPTRWANLKRKGNPPSFLVDTGFMASQTLSDSGATWAEVSNDTPYLIYHQEGTANMPRRELFLFQDSDIDFITDAVGEHYANKVISFFSGAV